MSSGSPIDVAFGEVVEAATTILRTEGLTAFAVTHPGGFTIEHMLTVLIGAAYSSGVEVGVRAALLDPERAIVVRDYITAEIQAGDGNPGLLWAQRLLDIVP